METGTVESLVREFILRTFWVDARDGVEMTDASDLVDAGVVDSMNVLKLVDFLEEEFDFMLYPEELFRLTSVENIAELVREKLA